MCDDDDVVIVSLGVVEGALFVNDRRLGPYTQCSACFAQPRFLHNWGLSSDPTFFLRGLGWLVIHPDVLLVFGVATLRTLSTRHRWIQ